MYDILYLLPILKNTIDLVQIRNTGIVGLLVTKCWGGGSLIGLGNNACKVTVNLDNL